MKTRNASIWPLLYAGLGVAASIAPLTLIGVARGTKIDPVGFRFMVFVGMPLLSVFSGVTSYFSLARRSTTSHLRARIWNSPPTNPQSNQLAQVIGFGCLRVSAALQRSDAGLRMFGIFGIWISIALLISLVVFRARHVRRVEREEQNQPAPAQRP